MLSEQTLEFAHSTSLNSLNFLYKLKLLGVLNKKVINQNEQNIFGMKFRNKLGTAAGLDKNGDYIDALGLMHLYNHHFYLNQQLCQVCF